MGKHDFISRWTLTPAIAALALVVAGCNGSDSTTTTTPTTQLRVIHASSDAPNVDVFVNGMQELTNIPYKSDSLFLTVPAGTTTVNVDPTGTSNSVINASLALVANQHYSLIAVGLASASAPAGSSSRRCSSTTRVTRRLRVM